MYAPNEKNVTIHLSIDMALLAGDEWRRLIVGREHPLCCLATLRCGILKKNLS